MNHTENKEIIVDPGGAIPIATARGFVFDPAIRRSDSRQPREELPPRTRDEATIVRNEGLLAATIDAELVLLDRERGEYYGFDPIATDIWNRLATPQTVPVLAAALAEACEGDPAVIERDLRALLEEMRARGMVTMTA